MFLRVVFSVFIFVSSANLIAAESDNSLGLGFILGAPTALSGKKILSKKNAVDFGLGYNWGHSVQAFSDYLFLFHNMHL